MMLVWLQARLGRGIAPTWVAEVVQSSPNTNEMSGFI